MEIPIPKPVYWLIPGLVLAVLATPAPACGPFFSESLLEVARAVMRPPRPSLEIELEQLTLDVPLPGGLEIPERSPARGPLQSYEKQVVPAITQLFHLSGGDLAENRSGCRDALLATDSDLARDVAEFAVFLEESGVAKAEAGRRIGAYRDLRAVMMGRTAPEPHEVRRYQNRIFSPVDPEQRIDLPVEWVPKVAIPAIEQGIQQRRWPKDLSGEWIDYLEGAADFHDGNFADAAAHFETLLARPAAERRFRSIPAAYMLGRCALKQGDPEMADSIGHFRRVLELAGEGEAFRDPFNLRWDALQAVADYELKFGRRELGARYYVALARVDYRYARKRLRRMFPEEQFAAAARDPFLRQVVTAVVIQETSGRLYWASPTGPRQEAWLAALENEEVNDRESSRLAWLAYSSGDFEIARRWLERGGRKDPLGLWIEAKLALQSGRIAEAGSRLEEARPDWDLPRGEKGPAHRFDDFSHLGHDEVRHRRRCQFWGDLGLVRLGNADFTGSLDAFMRSGYWRDAAYVAEQLLSREELLVYVRRHWLEAPWEGQEDLRYLTARRLGRDRYFKDARPLFPEEIRPVFDHYVENYRTFRDPRQSEETRAAAGWEAAQIHRKLGIELFGTEVAPDWRSLGKGNFSRYPHTRFRLGLATEARIDPDPSYYRNPLNDEAAFNENRFRWYRDREVELRQIEPTADERWRHRHYAGLPNVYRWHYRHVAADLAWEAARLMPGGDPKTAEVLCIAGSWLTPQAPGPADRFYKALVLRNRTTALGHEADMRRWFPKTPWHYDPWQAAGVEKPEWADDWW